MKKIDYDKLYVACPVYDYEIETEMYEQYETMGTIEHHIIVSPKRVLIYSKVDDEGTVRYYRYGTDEEVFDKEYPSSFSTTSSPWASLYCGYVNGHCSMPIKGLRDEFKARHDRKSKEVAYFIPFSQYMEEKFGISLDSISPAVASKIIRILNVSAGKSFELDRDRSVAREQLAKLGYHFGETKKTNL